MLQLKLRRLAVPARHALVSFLLGSTLLACNHLRGGLESEGCTQIACVDGLTIDLSPAGAKWLAGAHVFTVTTPAGTTTCKGALPLPACGSPMSLSCSGPPVYISVSGCSLPAEKHGFLSMELPDVPASVTVAIQRDGVDLVKKSLAPSYATESPNGPRCGPTCRKARETLRW